MSQPREPVPGIANLRRTALEHAVSTKTINDVQGGGSIDKREVLAIAREYLAFLTGKEKRDGER